MKLRHLLFTLPFVLPACGGRGLPDTPPASEQTLLYKAHAHNDYLHERPLLDALDHGFMSIEADVYVMPLLSDSLYVAHDAQDIRPSRTLTALAFPLMNQENAIEEADEEALLESPGWASPQQMLAALRVSPAEPKHDVA